MLCVVMFDLRSAEFEEQKREDWKRKQNILSTGSGRMPTRRKRGEGRCKVSVCDAQCDKV